MADPLATAYLRDAARVLRNYKSLGERALAQVSDADLHALVDPDANSIAIVVKHIAGNLRSRWTDFLTTDGEKPDRRRDAEFEDEAGDSRDALMRSWESGWQTLFGALAPLGAGDLTRTVTIRGEAHTVFEAIERQKQH